MTYVMYLSFSGIKICADLITSQVTAFFQGSPNFISLDLKLLCIKPDFTEKLRAQIKGNRVHPTQQGRGESEQLRFPYGSRKLGLLVVEPGRSSRNLSWRHLWKKKARKGKVPDEFLGSYLRTKRSQGMSCNIFLSLIQAFPVAFRFEMLRGPYMRGVYGNGIKIHPFNLPWHAQALLCIEITPELETVHTTSRVDPNSTCCPKRLCSTWWN